MVLKFVNTQERPFATSFDNRNILKSVKNAVTHWWTQHWVVSIFSVAQFTVLVLRLDLEIDGDPV